MLPLEPHYTFRDAACMVAVLCRWAAYCCSLARVALSSSSIVCSPALSVPRAIAKESCVCLQGSIDQVDGLLRFETDAEGLQQWDEQIGLVCNRLNTVLETAAAKGLLIEA